MRTDGQHKTKATNCVSNDPYDLSIESLDTMKVVRRSLHPLQIAADDKENLVGAGRMIRLNKPNASGKPVQDIASKKNDASPKSDKKKTNKTKEENTELVENNATGNRPSKVQEDNSTIIEDMTSQAGPSDQYWKLLAETSRKALDKILEEKEQLIERLCELTEENNQYKQLLADAQDIINTLNEMIADADSDINGDEETFCQH